MHRFVITECTLFEPKLTDGFCELVAGAMSVDPKIAALSGRNELLAEDRTYTDFQEMALKESQRADGIDAVVIATPP